MHLNHHAANQEPGTKRLLLIEMKDSRATGAPAYAHPIAYVVRYAERDHADPDCEGRMVYGDGQNAVGYRRATWSSDAKNAVLVDDFCIYAQITLRDLNGAEPPASEQKPYGTRHQFSEPYSVNRREAELMVKTFQKVERHLDKMNQEYGYLRDDEFAQYCIRVAKALGINTFLFPKGTGTDLSDMRNYIEVPAASVSAYVDDMLRKLRRV